MVEPEHSVLSESPEAAKDLTEVDENECEERGRTKSYPKSLVEITRQFMAMLQESEDGRVNLKTVAHFLNLGKDAASNKRRLYDITNVLEGCGLIEKVDTNVVAWKGGARHENLERSCLDAKKDLNRLERQEKIMDKLCETLEAEMKQMSQGGGHLQYKQLIEAFPDETILTIEPPVGTRVEVPDPDSSPELDRPYQLMLSAHSAIDVKLVNMSLNESTEERPSASTTLETPSMPHTNSANRPRSSRTCSSTIKSAEISSPSTSTFLQADRDLVDAELSPSFNKLSATDAVDVSNLDIDFNFLVGDLEGFSDIFDELSSFSR